MLNAILMLLAITQHGPWTVQLYRFPSTIARAYIDVRDFYNLHLVLHTNLGTILLKTLVCHRPNGCCGSLCRYLGRGSFPASSVQSIGRYLFSPLETVKVCSSYILCLPLRAAIHIASQSPVHSVLFICLTTVLPFPLS